MYLWNDIRIAVKGSNTDCMVGLGKYINAVYDHEYEGVCDISLSLINETENGIPRIPSEAIRLKSMLLNLDTDVRLDAYSFESQLWYVYSNHVTVWMDYKANTVIVSVKEMPYAFGYYNILTFILHPLGTLLENFGYYRLHGSCGTIDGRSVLFTGMDGQGKSTAAFALATHGDGIISDNITYIKKEEEQYVPSSLTKLVKLSVDDINTYFPELNRVHSATFDSGEVYYFLEDINKEKPALSSLKSIMLIERNPNDVSSTRPMNKPEILPLLFPTGIHANIEENTGKKFLFISELLDQVDVSQMDMGSDITGFTSLVKDSLAD